MREIGVSVLPSLSRVVCSGVSEPLVTLPGSCQWPFLASFPYHSQSQAPFAGRHTPASSVHRTCPPPCQPGRPLTGFRFARARCCAGLPVLPRFPSSVHTDAITPAGTTRCSCRLSSQVVIGLPLITGGSAPTLPFSRPAQRSFTFRSARSPSCSTQPFSPECFSPCRTLHDPPRLLACETTIVGWASHPTRKTRLSTAHCNIRAKAGAPASDSTWSVLHGLKHSSDKGLRRTKTTGRHRSRTDV